MIQNLIIPVAGASSRYPGMRPKWLLTMPNGKLMIEESVKKINCKFFTKIFVVALKSHITKYCNRESLIFSLKKNISKKIELVELEKTTSCQAETVAAAIKKKKIKGAILIKDCDNQFSIDDKFLKKINNSVYAIDINTQDLIDAKNKSYIEKNIYNNIVNIVEKKIVSDFFCCGAYSFHSAKSFLTYANMLLKTSKDVYISHVILKMLLNGNEFKYHNANDYIDWGTLREFRHWQRKSVTLFCDFDGCLVINGSKFGKLGYKTKPISENLNCLKKINQNYNLKLIIVTSRPKSELKFIRSILSKFDLKNIDVITDLPHGKRILINDFSKTNPYPSADSINLIRNGKELSEALSYLIN
tara:strand:+ start:332 stop:1405 length:1074 start_codon:yes stop_codon:yes gene_type:complete